MDRDRWKQWIGFPSWPCPACQTGNLRLIGDTVQLIDSRAERIGMDDPSANHDDRVARFVAHLKCDAPACGETGTLAGNRNAFSYRVSGEDDGCQTDISYQVLSVIPSPLPFRISPKIPRPIELLIREAASLFWSDHKAAATRIREAVEAILTDVGAPEISPRGKALNLHQRIDRFRELEDGKWAEQADLIEAAKWIGNLGAHDTITRDDALDAFDMLETVLDDMFVRARHDILAKARATNTKHRKPRAG